MLDRDDVFLKHGMKLGNGYSWISDFVYGGIDGAVTTFAVVAGVEGASLSLSVLLILGFANLFADGFSMSVGKFLSDRSNIDMYRKIEETEYQHLNEKPDVERAEIVEILRGYGFEGKELESATNVVVSNPKTWVDLMMRNEFSLTLENVDPIKGALVTLGSFILIGFIPLVAYVFNFLFKFESDTLFVLTSVFTLMALFVVGTVKSSFSVKSWYRSGIETALIGGVAAFIAYFIGYFLRGIV